MGKSLFIGVLVLTVIFAAITITVQRNSGKVAEMLSENMAEQQAANLAVYALRFGMKQLSEEKVQKTQIPVIGEGYFTQNFTEFNVLSGSIDSLRYAALNATKNTIKIISNVTVIVGADTVHHQSEIAAANPIEGLVGHWKMDEDSWNGTVDEVIDASGYDNHGNQGLEHYPPSYRIYTGATSIGAGKYDRAGEFDGIEDYVDCGNDASLNITDAITIEAWVKQIGIPSGIPITNCTELQNMKYDMNADYYLANDIDASATSGWNGGAGFEPIGTSENNFRGNFDGQGYVITDLHIDRPSADYVGLFGCTHMGSSGSSGGGATRASDGEIKNVGLENVTIIGNGRVGGLVGHNYRGKITNSYATGNVSGSSSYVGGLVGHNKRGPITYSYSTGSVSGLAYVGGLVGYNYYGDICMYYAPIHNSYSTCNVTTSSAGAVGGLVGYNWAPITNCYATGNVSGRDLVGGLVGLVGGLWDSTEPITNSYATGDVTGSSSVGGLVGCGGKPITNCYATGSVTGSSNVGGLLGYGWGGPITNSYSTGSVTGSSSVGGLVGGSDATITNSYYDTNTSGQSDTGKGEPKTTEQMKQEATFGGWDFTNLWGIEEDTYPFLQLQWDCIGSKGGKDAYSLGLNWDGLTVYGYISGNKITAPVSNSTDWHHLAMTFDGTDQKLYVDGVLETTTSPGGTIGTNSNSFHIGRSYIGYFDGIIDEVVIFDRALPADEIMQIYGTAHKILYWIE